MKKVAEKRYPVEAQAGKSKSAAVERGLSDSELREEIEGAERIENEAWREEWLGRVRAEIERRERL